MTTTAERVRNLKWDAEDAGLNAARCAKGYPGYKPEEASRLAKVAAHYAIRYLRAMERVQLKGRAKRKGDT